MMEFSLWPIFIVNVGVNSLLSFFTLSFLTYFALKLLRIQNGRLQALCLLIPFMKLITDLGSYEFSNWALAQQLNPLTSPEGTRMLSLNFWLFPFQYPLSSIDLHLSHGQTFTLADLLCLKIGCQWTLICALGLIAGTLWFLGQAIWQYRLSSQWLNKLCSISTPYSYPLQDSLLQSRIQHKKVAIYLTPIPHSPFIIGQRRPAIFISRALFDKLIPQEFEAIIAHELAHLMHGDLIVNAVLFGICHLFWWIPTRYFKTRLEFAQEYACDRLPGTSLNHLHLAEALYKAADWLHTASLPTFARSFATSHHAVKRLQALILLSNQRESSILKWIKIFLLMSWVLTLSFGKFWIF